jgi:LysR family transcriptional activator of nhaA
MDWLNYHHLLYFWVVAREGSIARACELLKLAQPTISHQIHELEEDLGQKLFARVGRNIQLTDTGRIVFNYANEIFTLGRELLSTVKGLPQNRPMQFLVGVAGFVPQLLVYRLLEPVVQMSQPVQLNCRLDRPEQLLADLATQQLDLVLSDVPARPVVRVRAYSHLLGECGVSFFAAPALATQYRAGFPQTLHGAPMLLPPDHSVIRRGLDQWFAGQGIYPNVRGEFADCALLLMFGKVGEGILVMPTAVEPDVQEQLGLEVIGQVDDVRVRCYAITVQRQMKHPAGAVIAQHARDRVFHANIPADGDGAR